MYSHFHRRRGGPRGFTLIFRHCAHSLCLMHTFCILSLISVIQKVRNACYWFPHLYILYPNCVIRSEKWDIDRLISSSPFTVRFTPIPIRLYQKCIVAFTSLLCKDLVSREKVYNIIVVSIIGTSVNSTLYHPLYLKFRDRRIPSALRYTS